MSKFTPAFSPQDVEGNSLIESNIMTSIKKTALASLCALATLTLATSNANATPLVGTGTWSVWSADTKNDDAEFTATAQQALPKAANELGGILTPLSYGTYTNSAINFADTSDNTVGAFLGDDKPPFNYAVTGGLDKHALSNVALTGSRFSHATLFEFTFTTSYKENVTISHDDGASLFVNTGSIDKDITAVNLLPMSSAAPTASGLDTVSLRANTTYDLWYSEVNGLPADLITTVPEPASLALLSIGIIGMGVIARRRRSSISTFAAC